MYFINAYLQFWTRNSKNPKPLPEECPYNYFDEDGVQKTPEGRDSNITNIGYMNIIFAINQLGCTFGQTFWGLAEYNVMLGWMLAQP